MPHCLIDNGIVVQLDLTGSPPDGFVACPEGVLPGFIFLNGSFAAPTLPNAAVSDYEAAIQQLIDSTARGKQFRDGVTLASYFASTNAQWAAEAQAFIEWRDAVWAYSYNELVKVQSGQRGQPTIDEILGELPVITWP